MTKPKKAAATFRTGRGYTQEDWDDVSAGSVSRPDDLAAAKPFAEVFPELAEAMRKTRGPQKAETKVAVTLRLDRDVVERFRASGKGWQSRINEILRRV